MSYRLFALPLAFACLPAFAAGDAPLAAKIVNYVLFFGGLGYLLRGVVGKFFKERQAKIRDSLAMAEKSREEAARRLDELKEKMKDLDRELEDISANVRQEAEREKARIQARAKEDAEKILAQAKADVENMRRESIAQLRTYAATLALDEAEKTIKNTITDGERDKLFADFSASLGAKS